MNKKGPILSTEKWKAWYMKTCLYSVGLYLMAGCNISAQQVRNTRRTDSICSAGNNLGSVYDIALKQTLK